MKHKKIIFTTTLLLVLGLGGLQAQQTIAASGGGALGSGGTVCYTVGQVAYNTKTGSNGSVIEGVQQAYEISVVAGIEVPEINLNISAYPNPTTDYLQLKVDASTMFSNQSLKYRLYDINGKLLQSRELTGNETQIDLNGFISSTYFVKVLENNQLIKNFKIVKN